MTTVVQLAKWLTVGRLGLHGFARSLLQGPDAEVRFIRIRRVIIFVDSKE